MRGVARIVHSQFWAGRPEHVERQQRLEDRRLAAYALSRFRWVSSGVQKRIGAACRKTTVWPASTKARSSLSRSVAGTPDKEGRARVSAGSTRQAHRGDGGSTGAN